MMSGVIIVHGGAGAWDVPKDRAAASMCGVKAAARAGYKFLSEGGSAVDAVEAAVMSLENNPLFNAGTGSILNEDKGIEMDALIMDGSNLKAGGVCSVTNILNPIQLSRVVMDKTEHVLLAGVGALAFAKEMGVQTATYEELHTELAQYKYDNRIGIKGTKGPVLEYKDTVQSIHSDKDLGTVGAVAMDKDGHIAVATSTGGMTGKRPGRVGDTPIIGGGMYADDSIGGVSCTGHGEAISKVCLAYRILQSMSSGTSTEQACTDGVQHMQEKVGGVGAGVIVIDKEGQPSYSFNTGGMAWAYIDKNKDIHSGMLPGDHNTEKFKPQAS